MSDRVPMSVLGGFLGAGKTTLLNRILSGNHGVRHAVLVNDFGELAVDGNLVTAHDGETITFANGCICCSMGDDLVGAIDRLLDGDRRPDQILVEASGVADPRAIADVATLHPGLVRDLVVVLVDVETVRSRHEDHRLQDTVARQLDAGELIVLNKCDRVTEEERMAAESWTRDRVRAPIIRSVDADIPMALLSAPIVSMNPASAGRANAPAPAVHGHAPEHSAAAHDSMEWTSGEWAFSAWPDTPIPATHGGDSEHSATTHIPMVPASAGRANAPAPAKHGHAHEHGRRFVSRSVPCPDPIDPDRLRAALSALMPRVLRAKGFVVSTGGPEWQWVVVQVCGRTVDLERWHPPPDHAVPAPGIVFIGLDDLPAGDELAGAVRQASTRDSSPSAPSPTESGGVMGMGDSSPSPSSPPSSPSATAARATRS